MIVLFATIATILSSEKASLRTARRQYFAATVLVLSSGKNDINSS